MLNKSHSFSAKPDTPGWVAVDPTRCAVKTSRIRLFCFPYAGGGTAPFYAWTKHLHPEVELLRIQLPGRETRLREAAFLDFSRLVETLTAELLPWLERPFAFFGHSMGALIAFETANKLREMGGPNPSHLFVSSFRAPHLPDRDPISMDIPDDKFVERLAQYEGMPQAVLDNSELMALFLPILRADFQVLNSYRFKPQAPMECPIRLFGSLDDLKTSQLEMEAWRNHTAAVFSSHYFQGGHFYIHENYPDVIKIINQHVLPCSSV
jgi:medium-chain acyl-[acyl-carrier-protein] hydrolase